MFSLEYKTIYYQSYASHLLLLFSSTEHLKVLQNYLNLSNTTYPNFNFDIKESYGQSNTFREHLGTSFVVFLLVTLFRVGVFLSVAYLAVAHLTRPGISVHC